MNRIRRISTELLSSYRVKFGTDFQENKKALDEIAIIRSKGLKNEIAGFITSYLRRELEEQKEKESESAAHTESIREAEEIEEQILN
ncbi:MAG: 40S ribosomal protein S17 [Thaumarchaeota archaeon]|nr:MAG: 40S ribosomal protein S17 [Nitrososphaerota archaeon]